MKRKERIKYIEQMINDSVRLTTSEIILLNKEIVEINANNGLIYSGHHIETITNADSKLILDSLEKLLEDIFRKFGSLNLVLNSGELKILKYELIKIYTYLVNSYLCLENDALESSTCYSNHSLDTIRNITLENVENKINFKTENYKLENSIKDKDKSLKESRLATIVAILSLIVAIIGLIVAVL